MFGTTSVESWNATYKTCRTTQMDLFKLTLRFRPVPKPDSETDSEPVFYECTSSKRFGLMVQNDEKIQSKQIQKEHTNNPNKN